MSKAYARFLARKQKNKVEYGFEVSQDDLPKKLHPFQKAIVQRSLKAGRFAIFADCGLGKTFMQLAWAQAVVKYTGGRVLILCPLSVAPQTVEEGEKIGITVSRSDGAITITNYEQIDNIDESQYIGIVLDESSILKNFDGKTRTALIDRFSHFKYRLACTATPAPNSPDEIGNHAEFLGVMPRVQMLAQYYVNDALKSNSWRLKGHAEKDYFEFIRSWSVTVADPADINFPMKGYDLPCLNLIEHVIETELRGETLTNEIAIGAANFNAELRKTILPRMQKAAELSRSVSGPVVIWINQNEEGKVLRELIPDAIEVKGDDKDAVKESRLHGFAKGEFKILITKKKIAQYGLNWQNCNTQIFASLDHSFEGTYQSIRRSWRYGQKNQVDVHLISTDTMIGVKKAIEEKSKSFHEMRDKLKGWGDQLKETQIAGYNFEKKQANEYTIYNGDCVQVIGEIPDESQGFSIFSPPFLDLYSYSSHAEDIGNSKNQREFMLAMHFLAQQMFRIMQSGRNVAIHCMDIPAQKGRDGYIGIKDFPAMLAKIYQKAGFIYHSKVTIWKNPVVEMQRTKALGLLHKQVKKDSAMSRVGLPDYLVVMRKPGENKNPITNTGISVDEWQKIASPVWMDIDYGDTLNSIKAEKDEKHICPLQLDTIERAIKLWSNPADSVFTPFMGIGSEVYQAIKMGRKGIGIELKREYFEVASRNVANASIQNSQMEMF